MIKHRDDAAGGNGQSVPGNGHRPAEASAADGANAVRECDTFFAKAATVGVIGVGVVLFEAALIPGMIIGVGAMLVPEFLPKFSAGLEPAFRWTVRGAYQLAQQTRHALAEAQEQIEDIVAETKVEAAKPAAPPPHVV